MRVALCSRTTCAVFLPHRPPPASRRRIIFTSTHTRPDSLSGSSEDFARCHARCTRPSAPLRMGRMAWLAGPAVRVGGGVCAWCCCQLLIASRVMGGAGLAGSLDLRVGGGQCEVLQPFEPCVMGRCRASSATAWAGLLGG